jgi:hypothetical protein
MAFKLYYSPPTYGAISNIYGGYADPVITLQYYGSGEYYPSPWRWRIERQAMIDWVNCPYLTYDYDDHWNEIDVPMLVFASELYDNRSGILNLANGISNTDFTAILLKNYGWLDVYVGKYSARDVSEPVYPWMVNHLMGVEKGDLQGTYRDWKVFLYQNQIYICPTKPITGVSSCQYIGTYDAEYYARLGKTIIDIAKPAIDECITGYRG